jgi:hypothetical protein
MSGPALGGSLPKDEGVLAIAARSWSLGKLRKMSSLVGSLPTKGALV